MLRARRADKKDRLETLEMRASSLVSQIRRDLGGGYVESVFELKTEKAETAFDSLKEVVEEAHQLKEDIEALDKRIDG